MPLGDQCSVEVFQVILVSSLNKMLFLWPQCEGTTFLYLHHRGVQTCFFWSDINQLLLTRYPQYRRSIEKHPKQNKRLPVRE
jgi:hypothetical protein